MTKTQTRARGRPKAAETMVQVANRWPRAMLDQVDAIVAEDEYGLTDRATVLRVLVAEGLKARLKRR